MVDLCKKYNIILGYSTTYYTQGNKLVESSNTSLMRVIKKTLTENKKSLALSLESCTMGKHN
jgi:hypothetical protein